MRFGLVGTGPWARGHPRTRSAGRGRGRNSSVSGAGIRAKPRRWRQTWGCRRSATTRSYWRRSTRSRSRSRRRCRRRWRSRPPRWASICCWTSRSPTRRRRPRAGGRGGRRGDRLGGLLHRPVRAGEPDVLREGAGAGRVEGRLVPDAGLTRCPGQPVHGVRLASGAARCALGHRSARAVQPERDAGADRGTPRGRRRG